MSTNSSKILFLVNPGSGKNDTDWKQLINDFFSTRDFSIEIFDLPDPCNPDKIKQRVKEVNAAILVAVGGDGTVKLAAEALIGSETTLGILPAGSANGMAKELGIPDDPTEAMEVLVSGNRRKIHLVKINEEICIHLGDIGFNAFVVKKFEEDNTRGMWGYAKAAWKVLWRNRRMLVRLKTDKDEISRDAAMVVIANATKYGNGVVINPAGSIYDDKFEVVIIKKISISEIFKMRFTQKAFDPAKTELFQTRSLHIKSRHFVHFQVDGETMGKVKEIKASLIPSALSVLVHEDGLT